MIQAFEAHYGQSFTDKDWRNETGIWAAAWGAAWGYAVRQENAAPTAPAQPAIEQAERQEPTGQATLSESECARLVQERDAAVRLAAERLAQMNADRKQYLDVRDERDTLKNLIKEARKIIKESAHARSSHSDWLNRTKDLP